MVHGAQNVSNTGGDSSIPNKPIGLGPILTDQPWDSPPGTSNTYTHVADLTVRNIAYLIGTGRLCRFDKRRISDLGKRKVLSEGELNQVVTPEPGQLIGVVSQMLGYDRLLVKCSDGIERICRIRGKMKRRVWIKVNDTVLVAPWDFQQSRGDILWRYTAAQAQALQQQQLVRQ